MEKIKSNVTNWIESEQGKDILTVIIVILVGLGSFELGRLSKGNDSSGIRVEYPSENIIQGEKIISTINPQTNMTATVNFLGKKFFASSRGTKYYSIGCSAGKTIKQENRVYFMTKEEAEGAGYELSNSCR